MYTIKQAAVRSGVSVPLLRAWERRYGIVVPARTASGYRLYDDAALARLQTMRRLVDEGWTPSSAAAAVLEDRAPAAPAGRGSTRSRPGPATDLVSGFIEAAARLDAVEVERVLDAMLADGTFETVADRHLLPALVALGEAWAAGRLDVAAEHAASHAVLRRLSAAFQAAGGATPQRGVSSSGCHRGPGTSSGRSHSPWPLGEPASRSSTWARTCPSLTGSPPCVGRGPEPL